MPASYAHYHFGKEVEQHLPEKERKIVEKYPELYQIGLHGPDILFYYRPFSKNKVNQLGNQIHERPGIDFFTQASKIIKRHEGNEAYMAYLYGFICHFALDEKCHSYINIQLTERGIGHAEVETEFDRAILIAEGKNPVKQSVTKHLNPSGNNAKIIAEFFTGITPLQIQLSILEMKVFHYFLRADTRWKQKLVNFIISIAGQYQSVHGMIMTPMQNHKCDVCSEHLMQLYKEALENAHRFIIEYDKFFTGEKTLDGIYQYNFNSIFTKGRFS